MEVSVEDIVLLGFLFADRPRGLRNDGKLMAQVDFAEVSIR